ncbi:hypothetical protein CAPTEDRAFT_209045 [Capitella teleta]|uniref:Uncharacterized protein n=1 Tax=Capitella teleta TaxID=283909 RepID=R7THS7_CAPTE|nr:hypothetical protein CAPTEDRAFT_209045 [Capitella teleta]|eukprot:ELT93279.1 hypothetical protein CAPTEDRAFT_209045 [Capitella teleta]
MGLKKFLKKAFLKRFGRRRYKKGEHETAFAGDREAQFVAACNATVCGSHGVTSRVPDSDDEDDATSYDMELNATVVEASLNESQFSEGDEVIVTREALKRASGSARHYLGPRASYMDCKRREQETRRDALRRKDVELRGRSDDLLVRGMMLHLDELEAHAVNARLHGILDATAPAVLPSHAVLPCREYQSRRTKLRLTRRPSIPNASFDSVF